MAEQRTNDAQDGERRQLAELRRDRADELVVAQVPAHPQATAARRRARA
jgi:hypothetical protein